MKKLFSIMLALTLALSLSATALAEGEETEDITIKQDSESKEGNTTVEYTVAPAYTVTIPAKVTLGTTEDSVTGTATVSAEGVHVPKNSQVVVRLTATGADDKKTFEVSTTEGASLSYTVKKGGAEITTAEDSNTVLSVDSSSGSDSATLTFTLADSVVYAGTYTGTVTFTVSVE